MARQVRREIDWNEGSDDKLVNRTGFLGFIHNKLVPDHRIAKSIPSMKYGCIEGVGARLGSASVKETETLLRRARMLQ
jgi:hypothetical protein